MSWQELSTDILNGFWQEQPTLPPRWFYDETGSRLFDEITQLPQYYPTRSGPDGLPESLGVLDPTSQIRVGHSQ